MNQTKATAGGWQAFCEKLRPSLEATGRFLKKLGKNLTIIGGYLYKLRAVILAAPVAAAAVVMAFINAARLPEVVEVTKLTLDTKAEESLFGCLVIGADYISRGSAIWGPLLLTVLCLVLMACSKRTFYPWLISLFSLLLPVIILITNVYPA